MKKIAIIAAVIMTVCCVIFFVGCGPSDEDAKLTSYNISAVLDTENMTLTAEETVTYINNYDVSLDAVYFHLYPAAYREGARFAPITGTGNIAEAYPGGAVNYGGITINSVTVDGGVGIYEIAGQDEDILIVDNVTLEPTEEVTIVIGFTVTVPQVRHRLGYINNTVNLGNWYPVASVYENGGWRTDPYYSNGDPFYSEVADYNVTLTVPAGWNVAGAGSVSSSIEGETITTVFAAKKIRDFAMVAAETMYVEEKTVGDVAVRYYYAFDQKLDYRMGLIEDSLNTFNELFGAYPYSQISVVQTNLLQGGMEYPQIVYISNEYIQSSETLYDETIIHEIAHQWWYAAVGNDEIYNAWMDEGLAEYSTTVFYEKNPDYGIEIEDRIADAMRGYILFSEVFASEINGVTSMNRCLSDYFSQNDYAYHTYAKGSLMFDSLRHLIGDEHFFTGLRNYYSENMHKIATPEKMIGAFETASNMKLQAFFKSWIEGTVGMYTAVTGI